MRTGNDLRLSIEAEIEKRQIGLRRVEAESGVSASTISRFIRGKELEYRNHEKLNAWLDGKNLPRTKPVSVRRMKVGSKTFLVTIEELL